MKSGTRLILLAGAACAGLGAPIAAAQPRTSTHYDVPAQPLGMALKQVGRTAGVDIMFAPSDVDGRTAPAVRGDMTLTDALDRLLAGTGLQASVANGTVVIRGRSSPPRAAVIDATEAQPDIIVTGSRIRGATVASPVIRISRDDARNAGQATLGEIVRSVPQSFGGGQNPGLGLNVPSVSGGNVSGGSSLNLRGLGSDATLTLLNGHRLSYSGSRQSIDVSTIPLGAVDRIEIVADGASALYGSDAVGGVANIILRRDMSGLEMRARIGAATRGGDVDQQYGVTGGARWDGGGFVAAYEFNRTSAIDFFQRDYSALRSPGLRLLPSARNHNALFSGHQRISPALEFSIDALFNARRNFLIYSFDDNGDLSLDRVETTTKDRAFAVAPALSLTVGSGLKVTLSGSYAEDRVDYRVDEITPGDRTTLTAGCYCNRARSVELAGDGSLFRLPGGIAKAALGVGYRNTYLRNDRGAGYPLNFARSQGVTYAYGELNLPLVGPENTTAGISRLNVSAAARYEKYDGIGGVTTPKIGLIYAPIEDVDFKASWGKSFRAPTLIQRYQPSLVTLYRVASVGGAGFPAGSTALYLQGGQAGLRPERATSWTISTAIHPRGVPGLSLELSYFSTRYVDRIVAPIAFASQAMSNPIYANFVNRAPTAAGLSAVIANAGLFSNASGAPYNAATVVAVVDNRNLNAGRQPVHGVDALLAYRTDIGGSGDSLAITANASYLVSSRQVVSGQAFVTLAGTVFNPPHWRGRSTASWRHAGLTVTAVVNYTGGLRDVRFLPAPPIPAQATFDLALHYRLPAGAPAPLRGLEFTLSAQNVFDRAPPLIATSFPTDAPYDSTNYSAIGRFVSLTIAKTW